MGNGSTRDPSTQINEDDQGAQGVSLGSFLPVDLPPLTLAALRESPTGTREDRLAFMVPNYVRRALEVLNEEAGNTSINRVALAALGHGLRRLACLPSVEIITSARATVLRSGSDDIVQFDGWRYHIQAREGQERLYLKCVSPTVAGTCSEMARGLGLPTGTIAVLTIIAGIIDMPALNGNLPFVLKAELLEFTRALRPRASYAVLLQSRASISPPQRPTQVSWNDVVREED